MSDPIVGIDLGTSNSVVAYADETGAARVLADPGGFKIHPSVVSFHPNGGVVVGAPAKQRRVIDPKNTIYSVKRLIGRAFDSKEVQTARQRSPFAIEPDDKRGPVVVTRAGKYAVPEISAIMLDYMRQVASKALETEVQRAVVTVPASFNDAQRSATATAGAIAGLTIVRVLNEPTAAALAYGHTRNLREIIAVFDFGGGTFDITILKLHDQVYEVLGTAGDTFLGGDDLDERIVDKMVAKFLAENRVDLRQHEVAMMRLRAVAEQTKIELSRRSRALVKIDEIAYGPKGKPLDLQIEITRDEFVAQVADIIDRTFPVCEEALKYAQLTTDHVDDVVLVGGTTKIPYVRDQVTKFFAKAPRTDVSPEEAVALGSALQAQALDRVLRRPSQRAKVPDTNFDTEQSTASGEALGSTTTTLAGSTMTGEITHDSIPTIPSLDPGSSRVVLDEPVTQTTPRARNTAGYGAIPKQRPDSEPRLERPVERGQHHDVFEERTPPPGTAAIGRLTRAPTNNPANQPLKTIPGTAAAVPEHAPHQRTMRVGPIPRAPAPSPATTLPAMPPPVAPPPVPARAAPPPVPQAPPPMPPPVPQAPPQAKTLVVEPSPASTARGFAPPAQPTAPTLVAPQPVVLDVTPRGLGIGTVAGFCEELIRRNSRLPTETRKLFTTSRDLQEAVRIIVVQGESRRMHDNIVIGDLRLENLPPRPRGETSIEVTFALDASGILQVRARDAKTGREQSASLDLVGSMATDEVEASRERLQTLRR